MHMLIQLFSLHSLFRSEERLRRCKACSISLLTALHSWPGLLSLSSIRTNSLRSLLHSLQSPADPSQKIILETLFNVFLLKIPKWTDVFHEALMSCGKVYYSSWPAYYFIL